MNLQEKVRVVDALVETLGGVREVSNGFFVGRRGGEEWLRRLEDWGKICDGLIGEYGKKLGVGEGVTGKKSSGMTGKIMRGFDRITSGKK